MPIVRAEVAERRECGKDLNHSQSGTISASGCKPATPNCRLPLVPVFFAHNFPHLPHNNHSHSCTRLSGNPGSRSLQPPAKLSLVTGREFTRAVLLQNEFDL